MHFMLSHFHILNYKMALQTSADSIIAFSDYISNTRRGNEVVIADCTATKFQIFVVELKLSEARNSLYHTSIMFAGGDAYGAGASQFNGGGFMPSPGAQAAGGNSVQKSNYGNQSQSMRRVTIKQIYSAGEGSADGVIIDGKEISNVSPKMSIKSQQPLLSLLYLQTF